MKHLLYLVFGWLLLVGYSKKPDDPTPTPPAQAVAGLYTMSSITTNGQTISLPFTANGISMSGTIKLAVVAGKQDEANMTLTLKITGSPNTTDNGAVQVKATSKGYQLFDNGQKTGVVEGNTLTLTCNSDVTVATK